MERILGYHWSLIWALFPVLVLVVCASTDDVYIVEDSLVNRSSADKVILKFTTTNLINYGGATNLSHGAVANFSHGAALNGDSCLIKCESHDSLGVSSMGIIDLPAGQEFTWSKAQYENGPDYIHCQFGWKSTSKQLEYDVYSIVPGHLQPIVAKWLVNEEGLFSQSGSGIFTQVIRWSG